MHVTASIGVLLLDATTRLTIREALVAVDIAMYRAKDAGRDRVRLATATADSRVKHHHDACIKNCLGKDTRETVSIWIFSLSRKTCSAPSAATVALAGFAKPPPFTLQRGRRSGLRCSPTEASGRKRR